jgi:hypothetical protein
VDRKQIETEARKLFDREIELDQKLFDSLQPAAPEEIGEAAAELSADELLERMRDTPSHETDAAVDAQERDAHTVAGRAVDAGQCRVTAWTT